MKTLKLFATVCLATLLLTTSCEEKDYYDPNYQTENPLGNITAPDGFDWSMTRSVPVNVQVNDELLGEYHYTVTIYADDPLTNPEAGILGRGFAKENKNFVSEIVVTPDIETVYVEQLDPRGRKRIQTISTANDIKVEFTPSYHPMPETRAMAATRAVIEIPDYSVEKEEYINATNWTGGNLSSNKNYKIEKGATVVPNSLTFGGTNIKLFVAGKLNIKGSFDIGSGDGTSGAEFIILDGGEVTASSLGSKQGKADIIIMPGGKLTITGNGKATVGDVNSVYVFGEFNIPNGQFDAQNGDGSIFYVGSGGVVTSNDFQIHNDKTYIENHGYIHVQKWTKGGGAATVYNLCVIESESNIDFTDIGELFQDGGICIAKNNITFANTSVKMRDGSLIECTNLNGGCRVEGLNMGNRNLIKAKTIGSTITITNDVTVETESASNRVNCSGGADVAPYGTANILIDREGCKVNYKPEEPEEPEYPIITPVVGRYTFLFEDQWPLYGDYDMNDVVFKLDNIKHALSANNLSEKTTFDITLLATGAQKRIGVELMLDRINATTIGSVKKGGDLVTTTTSGTKPVIPLFEEVHAAFNNENPNAWYINVIREGDGTVNNADPVIISLEIAFSNPVMPIDLNINRLNFFITTDDPAPSGKRREIHLVGFEPTNMADDRFWDTHNDASLEKNYYVSKDNLSWGMVVPDNFRWLLETKYLPTAYPDFAPWITSGGSSTAHKEWWKSEVEGSIQTGLLYLE